MTAIDKLIERRVEYERLLAEIDQTIADAIHERAIRAAWLAAIAYAIQIIEEEEGLAPAHAEPEKKRRNLRKLVIEAIKDAGSLGLTQDEMRVKIGINQRDLNRVISHWSGKKEIHCYSNGAGSFWRLGSGVPMAGPLAVRDVLLEGPLSLGDLVSRGLTEKDWQAAEKQGLVERTVTGYRLRPQTPESAAA